MKRKILKFDQFLVWIFQMDKGEVKNFTAQEITRGLKTYGDMTMNPISVFVKGSFVTHRDGMEPLFSHPGDGGARYVVANSLNGFALEALEDGSEYHCITPRDHVPQFWNRHVWKLDYKFAAVPYYIAMVPERYIYVASGEVTINETKVQARQMARIKNLCDMAIWDDVIAVEIWK
jgi:hypothetical protein